MDQIRHIAQAQGWDAVSASRTEGGGIEIDRRRVACWAVVGEGEGDEIVGAYPDESGLTWEFAQRDEDLVEDGEVPEYVFLGYFPDDLEDHELLALAKRRYKRLEYKASKKAAAE